MGGTRRDTLLERAAPESKGWRHRRVRATRLGLEDWVQRQPFPKWWRLAGGSSGSMTVSTSNGERRSAAVDQITLHYSDGTTQSKGAPGGAPVPAQMFDPAVDGHIIQVDWDEIPRFPGSRTYLGGGYRFLLSGGKVITVDGESCKWRKGG